MKGQDKAQVLTVYIGEDDKWHTGLPYPAIVERMEQIGVAGVNVFHGSEGFGSHHKLHTARFENLFQALPVVIEVVDVPPSAAPCLRVYSGQPSPPPLINTKLIYPRKKSFMSFRF